MKSIKQYIDESGLSRPKIPDVFMNELVKELENNGFKVPNQVEVTYETVKGIFGNEKKYKVTIKDKSINRSAVMKIVNKYRELEHQYPLTKLQRGYTDISVKW